MKQLLVVVDMQVDFVTGALGSNEAKAIVENVVNKVREAKAVGKTVVLPLIPMRLIIWRPRRAGTCQWPIASEGLRGGNWYLN